MLRVTGREAALRGTAAGRSAYYPEPEAEVVVGLVGLSNSGKARQLHWCALFFLRHTSLLLLGSTY